MFEQLTQTESQQVARKVTTGAGRKPLPQSAFDDAIRLKNYREGKRLAPKVVAAKIGVATASYRHMETMLSISTKRKYGEQLVAALGEDARSIVCESGAISEGGNISPGSESRLSKEAAQKLAKKARELRRHRGIALATIANAIGVLPVSFRLWELSIPRSLSKENQALWERQLGVEPGWLLDENAISPIATKGLPTLKSAMAAANLASASDEILSVACWFARKNHLNRTIDPDQLNQVERVWFSMFVQRYGVNGPNNTLEDCGNLFGLTRERARQILAKFLERTAGIEIDTPRMDSLVSKIQEVAPITTASANERFRAELGPHLEVLELDMFAREVLGRSIATISQTPCALSVRTQAVLLPNEDYDPDFTRTVREVAFRMIRQCGAAQVHYVVGVVSEETKTPTTSEKILKAAKLIEGFDWIIEKYGWFWFGEQKDNRVLTIVEKILAVADGRVDVEDIYDAVGRSRRWYDDDITVYWIDPPHSVLVALLSKLDWVQKKQRDDFCLKKDVDPRQALTGLDLMLYEVLEENGNCAARSTLNQALLNTEKASMMGLHFKLEGSPFVKRLQTGLYALRGRTIAPHDYATAVEQVVKPGATNKANTYLPDEQGNLVVHVTFSQYAYDNSVMGLPADLCSHIKLGEYAIHGAGIAVRINRSAKGSLRILNLVGLLKQQGFNPGDQIRLHFDVEGKLLRIEKWDDTKHPMDQQS